MLVAGCAAASGSARPAQRPVVHVAVSPAVWATDVSVEGVDVDGAMARALARGGRVRVSPLAARRSREPGCARDATCAGEATRALGASKLVRTELAGLGATVLVRASVVDAGTLVQEQTVQEVVHHADPARVGAAIGRLGERLAKPWAPPPPRRAWYEQPWLWVGAAAAVTAGVATGIGVAVGSGGDAPDVVVTPP
ncbi:hypothetical protein [Sorangium sp. So ce542]|uniref:hypothetical protein n=1 Tax=Sorangium sp. So ce542 TaxID=3133316 RepID=UPI003F61A924